MTLTEFYEQLMIIQYYEQPKARAEISLKAGYNQDLRQFINDLKQSFDLDIAVDDRLDKIGKLVGLSRIVSFAVPKKYFGFSDNSLSYGFADRFNPDIVTYPFKERFEPDYTSAVLNNDLYRKFIKAKIAKNTARAVMVGDSNSISLQDVIVSALDENAYIVDNKDMTLTLYVSYSLDVEILNYVIALGLLPRPQGVNYNYVQQYSTEGTFGFSDNPVALGFSDRFDPSVVGGTFANRIR